MNQDELNNLMYGTRLLVFLETEPQSNKYRQVMLTPDEFKKVSMNIGRETGRKDQERLDVIEIIQSEDVYDLPDLQQTYSNVKIT